MSNSQPVPISGNVINGILYLEIPENNSRHVDKCCTAGLGSPPRKFGPSAAVLKGVNFKWSIECQKVFEQIQAVLASAPVLAAPNFNKNFELTVHASDIGIGAVLQQKDDDGVVHPFSYYSKKHQKNYLTIEKEALALLTALQ